MEHPHFPAEHVASLVRQTLPHEPQLLLSVPSLTHFPAQQLIPVPQAFPHAPQFLLSVLVLTHDVPHAVGVAAEQVEPQTPPLHVADPLPAVGPGHTLPQAPQLNGSLLVLLHVVPLQRLGVGFVHVSPHTPKMQVVAPVPDAGAEHLLPHAPQLLVSVNSLTHTPLHNVSPKGHTHNPSRHAPPVHVLPHPPQLLVSVSVLTHEPLQAVCPKEQPEHAPLIHEMPPVHA